VEVGDGVHGAHQDLEDEGEPEMLGDEVGEADVLREAKGERELVVDADVVLDEVELGETLGVDELDLDTLDDAVLVGVAALVLVDVMD
jgi:hypothetical protein